MNIAANATNAEPCITTEGVPMSSDKFGKQFDAERFANADAGKESIQTFIKRAFDAHHVIPTEPDEAYDNFADEKAIHQVLDYGGIDFVVDPFKSAPFGVNHRTHEATETTLRFDMRKETGTSKPSELDELISAGGGFALLPRYATRAKRNENGGFEWARVVDLRPLINAIRLNSIEPDGTWSDENGVVAWFFEYESLREMDAIHTKFEL